VTKRLPGDERGHVPVARLATRAQRQLALVNGVLVALRQRMVIHGEQAASAEIIDLVATPLRRLLAVRRDRQFPMAPQDRPGSAAAVHCRQGLAVIAAGDPSRAGLG